MRNGSDIAEDIFKILKGNGYTIEIFTDEGASTIDPSEARRFFIPKFGMVNLDEESSKSGIRISINKNTDIKKFKQTMDQLKKLANRSIIEYTLKTYSKTISPKDQEYQAQRIKKMNEAKLFVRHTKVNEGKIRKIKAIFIESEGKRHQIGTNNLNGGKAMLNHVNEGGMILDKFGKYITESCNEIKLLNEFKRHCNHYKIEDSTTKIVDKRIATIKENVNKIRSKKHYIDMRFSFDDKKVRTNESDILKLRKEYMMEDESSYPHVAKASRKQRGIDQVIGTLDILKKEINKFKMVKLDSDMKTFRNDPLNPLKHTVRNPDNIHIGRILSHLSDTISHQNNQGNLSDMLARSANLMFDADEDNGIMKSAISIIRPLTDKLRGSKISNIRPVTESWEEKFERRLNKFDSKNLF